MTALHAARDGGGRGFVAAVAERAERWLLDPAPPRPRPAEPVAADRPVIAVIGLDTGSGATMIARALAVELARRDDGGGGAAIVTASTRTSAAGLATAPARRLSKALSPATPAAAGRLCLIDPDDPAVRDLARDRPAPLVLDVDHGRPPEVALALADVAVLVATPVTEPALADVVAASLSRDGGPPAVVLNRATEPGEWRGRCASVVGESRLGARLALAGRDPTPGLARSIAALADLLVGEA